MWRPFMGIDDINPVTPHPPSSSHLFKGVFIWESFPLDARILFMILLFFKFIFAIYPLVQQDVLILVLFYKTILYSGAG